MSTLAAVTVLKDTIDNEGAPGCRNPVAAVIAAAYLANSSSAICSRDEGGGEIVLCHCHCQDPCSRTARKEAAANSHDPARCEVDADTVLLDTVATPT